MTHNTQGGVLSLASSQTLIPPSPSLSFPPSFQEVCFNLEHPATVSPSRHLEASIITHILQMRHGGRGVLACCGRETLLTDSSTCMELRGRLSVVSTLQAPPGSQQPNSGRELSALSIEPSPQAMAPHSHHRTERLHRRD